MTTLHGSLRLRPTRIGFLVDPSDSESLRRIFQVCTCLWGGMFNPIIPVCSSVPDVWSDPPFPAPTPTELATGYLNFFEPDVFVEARAGLAEEIGLQRTKLDFNQSRIILLEEYFTTREPYPFSPPFGMDCGDIYRANYEREFKFVSHRERRIALFDEDPQAATFVEAAFGGFPTEGPLASLAGAYIDAFDPVKFTPNAENWTKVVREGFRFPMSFAMEGLKADHRGWNMPTLFVVDPASPLDLIDLWNLRQFQEPILPVNLAWLRDAKEYIVALMKANHRPLPGNPNGVMISLTIQFGRSIVGSDHQNAMERCRAIISEAGLDGVPNVPVTMKLWYDRIWRGNVDDLVHRPQPADVSAGATDLELSVSNEGADLSCRFTTLSPEFSGGPGLYGTARWVNVLNLRNYRANDTLALTLPSSFNDDTARHFRLGGATIISREGFVLPQKYKRQSEYFRLLTGRDALIDWLKHRGIVAQPSNPGRIAEQVLASLNGFYGAGLLADHETIKLLDDMAKSVRRFTDGKVEEFPDRSAEVKRWKDLVNRRANAPWRGTTLDQFIEANMLRLGLVLACPNCQNKNWFGLENLRSQLTCERCLKMYPFPQGSLNFQQTPWHYRVVGPFSVPNYAEGAYSTVLALAVFAFRLGGDNPNLTYTTGLELKIGAENPIEVDFTFWYQRTSMFGRNEEPALVFGEAKSFAAESFKPEDIARMGKLAETFPRAFLVFATLKDELSAAEKSAIGSLALWGRETLQDGAPRTPVIVLTATELFCPWNLQQTWKEIGGRRAALSESQHVSVDNLWRLAELTQQIYLDLPDPRARFQPPSKT